MFLKCDDVTELRLLTPEMEEEEYQLIRDNLAYLGKWTFWMNESLTREQLHDGLAQNVIDYEEGTGYVMGVFVDGKLVGSVNVSGIASGKPAEVGYWIVPLAAGKDLATKCTRALMDYVRQKHGVYDFELYVMEGNQASIRVAEKLGFAYEKTVHNDEQGVDELRYKCRAIAKT